MLGCRFHLREPATQPTNSARDLSPSAYVRTVVTGGAMSMSEQEAQARRDASGMMKDLLQERRLDPGEYDEEVWTEELRPRVEVVWVAAVRKR